MLRARRAALSGSARAQADRALSERLDALVAGTGLQLIAGYWAMKDEPELAAVLARWSALGRTVLLPKVVAADAPLVFLRWEPGAAMVAGPFGTVHPADGAPMRPELLVIPCLGFDPRCYRLGYGGGYYDRTLEGLPEALGVGVAYDCCALSGFVPHAHDLPLDCVVTETRVLRRRATDPGSAGPG